MFYLFLRNDFLNWVFLSVKTAVLWGIMALGMGAIFAPAHAGEIRDTELENMVRAYTFPILKSADMNPKDVRLYIIADTSINAAVFGQKRMLIHTGLILAADEPEDILGIIAHEIAHMKGNHVAQKQGDIIANAKNQAISATAGVLAGLASGNSNALMGGLALSEHLAQRQYLQYSRAKEQVADTEALKYLQRAGISPRGIISVLDKIRVEYGDNVSPYILSHPLPKERIAQAHRAMQKSPHANKNFGADYTTMLHRGQAKIVAYTMTFDETMGRYPLTQSASVVRVGQKSFTIPTAQSLAPTVYAHAIAHMRAGRFGVAHKLADILITNHPKDPFYLELRADIYKFEKRPKDALDTYKQVLKIIPWASLIHQSVSDILLEKTHDDTLSPAQRKGLAQQALNHLIPARRIDPAHAPSAKNMAQAYNILGNRGKSALAMAEYNVMIGNFYLAKRNAELADRIFTEYTPDKVKAQDILAQIEIIMNNAPAQ